MTDWTTLPLGKRTINLDRRRVPVTGKDREPGPYPYYGASGVVDHVAGYLFDGLHLLIAEDGENLRTRKTPIAFLADGKFWVNNHAHIVQANDENDLRYLSYAVESSDLSAFITGSTQPKLSQAAMNEIPISAPSLGEQRRIAATLGALDDKIESNRRVGTLALDLAESLYDCACSEGFDAITLQDAGKWLSGNTPSTSTAEYWDGELPWISSASLKSFYVHTSDRTLTGAGAEVATNIVPAGTLLMVVRGMSLKTEFRFGVAQRDVAFGQDCKAIIPSIDSSVLAIALRAMQESILDLVDEAGHGTGRLSTDLLQQVPIAVPRDATFAPKAAALVAKGAVAASEADRLARLRDALLPELLAGRIRVSEAEVAIS